MASDIELWGAVTGLNVTLLQRWSSAWADLLAADLALDERGRSNDSEMENVLLRRALWESAVASYGRCVVSSDRRKIPFNEFAHETVGGEGLEVHKRIMDWRHGHVAHRNRAEFESVAIVLTYSSGKAHPSSLNVVVSVDAGPMNDAEFVAAFQGHVKTLRDAIWEKKIFPLAESVVDDLNAGRIARPTDPRPADDEASPGRYVINQCITALGRKAAG